MDEEECTEMFFIKKDQTQCIKCEAHLPKYALSHMCGTWKGNEPQYDVYVGKDGHLIRRMIFLKEKRFVFLRINESNQLEVFSEFKVLPTHEARSDQKKNEEDSGPAP